MRNNLQVEVTTKSEVVNRAAVNDESNAPSKNDASDIYQRIERAGNSQQYIQTIENRNQFDTLERGFASQPPIQQYQNNQQIIQRDEVNQLFSISLFA
ncbi:hypothetical protein [Aliikangiella maris]|uniref:Uncharacterized protein n=1 Tax=Aliikangiella maris TaxID=3162458 RepID=A0ABV2BUP6_9GAMM